MAGLKDAYKNKSSEGYKDVFKEQSRKSGDYTSTPIEALRKSSKKTAEKWDNFQEYLKIKRVMTKFKKKSVIVIMRKPLLNRQGA